MWQFAYYQLHRYLDYQRCNGKFSGMKITDLALLHNEPRKFLQYTESLFNIRSCCLVLGLLEQLFMCPPA